MRNVPLAVVVGLIVVAAQGCNLKIPNGLVFPQGLVPVAKEAENCQSLLFKLDANGDKSLTAGEYVEGRVAIAGTRGAKLRPEFKLAFKYLDQDDDGIVTAKQFLEDCDGAVADPLEPDPVSEEEETPAPERTPRPTATGLIAHPILGHPIVWRQPDCEPRFTEFDHNGDGGWDYDEFQAWRFTTGVVSSRCFHLKPLVNPPADAPFTGNCGGEHDDLAFAQLDRDQDQLLSPEEFCTGLPDPLPLPTQDWNDPHPTSFPTAYAYPVTSPRPDEDPIEDPEDDPSPGPEPEASPPSAEGCLDQFFAFDANRDKFVSYDEYAVGRFKAIYFREPPRQQIAAPLLDSFKVDARAYDQNSDGRLAVDEFVNLCQDTYRDPEVGTTDADEDSR